MGFAWLVIMGFAWLAAAALVPAAARTEVASVNTGDPQVQARAEALAKAPPVVPPCCRHVAEDPSGRKQVGKASVYSTRFQGRRMANGQRFHHTGSDAASRTLPIGTQAKVTNLQTGRTALVTVKDRGPFVDGRTVDVSRATANELGISGKDGVAPVEVAPVAVPQPNGTVAAGAGALPGPATALPGKWR